MKRIINILIALFSTLNAFSQSGKAFYIYRNDGEFNAFLYEDIDSLVHSNIGLDSVMYKYDVVQEVWTQDSIYRIPLAVIDSVSFTTPEPIVNEKVFELTDAHDPYLSECDTIRFTLSLDTPSEMRPSKGNIVVSTYDCLSFPDGIMARVVSQMQDNRGIHYNCEKVGLEDVYDQLIFIGEGYIEDREINGRRKAEVTYERELWNMNWSKTLKEGGTTTTMNVGDAAKMVITVNIQVGKPMYFRLDLLNTLTSSISFNAISSFEKYYEKEIAKVTLPRIRIPQCPLLFITPKIKFSGYFAEGATVSLDCNAYFNRTDKVSFVYQNNEWSVFHTPKNEAGVDVASLSMTGYAEIGIIPDLFFSLSGSATGMGVECMVGVKESVDFKFDAVASFDEGMYSALKDSYARTTIPWSVRPYVQLGLFGDGQQFNPRPFSGEPQWGTDKYLLPAFTGFEYQKGEKETTAVLKTKPSRDLLLPVQLGIAFYEEETKLETKYISATYRNQNEWTFNGVQAAYEKMEDGKIYLAYPMVKIMGKEMRALPYTEFPTLLTCPNDYHPHAIDLGLPSGTKWSCCNLGAKKPEGYGGYYAWGETSEKSYYGASNYKYAFAVDSGENLQDDYDPATGQWYRCTNIGHDIAGTNYDVAHVRMGTPWHMPTLEQRDELINYCSFQWTQQNGVNGITMTGPNGGCIFIPAAGWHWTGGFFRYEGEMGTYFTSTLDTRSYPQSYVVINYAYGLVFGRSGFDVDFTRCNRVCGNPVRAVRP